MRRRKKIFRPNKRYRIRRRNGNIIKIITGVAAVAVLVFVGYSAAGPVSKYLEERAERRHQTEQLPLETPDAPQSTAALPEADAVADIQTEAPLTEILPESTETSVINETTAPEEQVTAAPTETTAEQQLNTEGAAYSISAEDMTDIETLNVALDDMKNSGCSAVIFPMKTEGGIFNYTPDISFAHTVIDGPNPFMSELTAKEIADAAKAKGLRPVAMISVLTDNNRYGDYRDGSYRSLDDSTWLDTSPEKGGKPWISPFDPVAQEYLCDTVTELGEAGFAEIICDDFIFPEFRSSDVELLGDGVSPYSDRYLALTNLAVMMTEAGNDAGAEVMLRITANSIIKGYSELFHPEELSGCKLLIDFSENNIARTMISGDEEVILDDMDEGEKVKTVFAEVNERCGGIGTEPMLDSGSMSADDFSAAVMAVSESGYDKYYVY